MSRTHLLQRFNLIIADEVYIGINLEPTQPVSLQGVCTITAPQWCDSSQLYSERFKKFF